jgi:signal transduction histidine kinase
VSKPAPLRLRTLLIILGLASFGLPLAGLYPLRVYDNQLVRQTETELVAQGAVVSAAYGRALAARIPRERLMFLYGRALPEALLERHDPSEPFTPVPSHLNVLAERVRPRAEPARPGPLADADARAAGAEVEPLMRLAQRTTLAGMRIVDPQGVVVATSREEGGQSLLHREEVMRALAGENVSLLRERISDEAAPPLSSLSRGTGVRVFVAMPVLLENRVVGAVVLARTPQSLGKAFYQDRRYLAGAALVLLVAVFAVTLLMARYLVRPLQALTRQADEVAAGRPAPPPLSRAGTVEIARLSRAFSDMAHALEQRADYIRSFAAAVSHEFKTPLAALQGTIELLRDHDATMAAEDRARFLGNADKDIGRLDRLVRRLLELARADVMQPEAAAHAVVPVIAALAERYAERPLYLAPPPTDVTVAMTPAVLEAVLTNLVDNAFQHGGPQAQVWVEARREAGGVVLTIENDGQSLSPANAARAFDPFFTTARAHGGTGLGLTIVRALVKAHGGSVELMPVDIVGKTRTRATVRLPAAETKS